MMVLLIELFSSLFRGSDSSRFNQDLKIQPGRTLRWDEMEMCVSPPSPVDQSITGIRWGKKSHTERIS